VRIAVIIPTCDRPHLLQRALASVAVQTRKPHEVIVVNDGSDDITSLSGFSDLSLVENVSYSGASAARNKGASASNADVLAFLDDDDTWDPTYLEICESIVHTRGANLVLSAFNKVGMNGTRAPEKVPPSRLRASDWLVRNQGLRGSNLFIARHLFDAVGGFDEMLPAMNDMDLAIRLAEHPALRYARQPDPLVNFHVHRGQRLSTPGSDTNRTGVLAFLKKHGPRMTEVQRSAFRERVYELWGWYPGTH
jgi:glycosyltransferase involved in cell wall biosynthesis